ncbi:MAG: hypothetical protein J6K17_00085 [Oscillospiraceae bacterium]|nr:hypothetical protein [Oscillospiraceae bacterium]
MNTLIALMLILPLALIIATVAAIPITLIQIADERKERREQKKKLRMLIKVYTRLSEEETEPENKAYRMAKLYGYKWALEQMEGGRK